VLQIGRDISLRRGSAEGGQAPALSVGSRIKVQSRKLSMIFLGSFIISLCGFDFILEVAEGDGFAVGVDSDGPSFFSAVPADAFVF